MTPEEKAIELIGKFSSVNSFVGGEGYLSIGINNGKQCAIICVEQILMAIDNRLDDSIESMNTEYWDEVLEHIKKQ